MPREIPSLWSELLKPGILSPLAILKSQAEALKEQTNGILVPEIDSEEHLPRIKHILFIVVPALDGFRYSALEVVHHKDRPYPVFTLGPGLTYYRDEFNKYAQQGVKTPIIDKTLRADNEEEFILLLSQMLQHPTLVGTLQD
jgi:hypothetical protein